MIFKLVSILLTVRGQVVDISTLDSFFFAGDCESARQHMQTWQPSVSAYRVVYLCGPQVKT